MSEAPETRDVITPSNTERVRGAWAVGLTLAASLLRFLPHSWNLTPLGAIGLFAGARLPLGYAFALALGVRACTDLILQLGADPDARNYNFFFTYTMFAVYACLALNVLIGRWLCRTGSVWRVGAGSLLGSVGFFLATNFVCWLGDPRYPATLSGLLQDYAESLPFFRGTLAGDLLYAGALFGVHAYAMSRVPVTEPKPVVVTEE